MEVCWEGGGKKQSLNACFSDEQNGCGFHQTLPFQKSLSCTQIQWLELQQPFCDQEDKGFLSGRHSRPAGADLAEMTVIAYFSCCCGESSLCFLCLCNQVLYHRKLNISYSYGGKDETAFYHWSGDSTIVALV